MPLRPRPAPHAAGAADRVRSLLAPPGGGWVPPEEPGPEAVDETSEPQSGSWSGPDGVPRASRSHAAPGLRLPAGTRLDPGRRGAVALVALALVAALVAGAVVLRGRPQEVAVPVVAAPGVPLPGASVSAAPATEVVVAVGGKVRRPGLVRLPTGSRVDDAVRAAGGPLPGAEIGQLNLARRLVDGEQVLVGVPAQAAAGGPGPAAAPGGLLDLNTATASDFDALPGIGPVLAQRIVDWRTEHGRFASVDQLREVTGIGEAKYGDLEDKVTV